MILFLTNIFLNIKNTYNSKTNMEINLIILYNVLAEEICLDRFGL